MGRTALLVIDMSNDLLKNPENPLYCPHAEEVIERVVELVAFAHREGWPVVYVQDAHRVGDADFTVRPVHAVKGTWGAELIPELQRQRFPGDYDVPKRRHSGFSYTDLDLFLREEKIDTVVLTGVWTNVCVRSTASDAMYLGYNVICLSDATTSQDEAMHEAGLRDISLFGRIMTVQEYEAMIRAARQEKSA